MSDSLSTLVDLLGRPEFLTGLLLGAIGYLTLFIRPTGRKGPWALVVAIAVGVGLYTVIDYPGLRLVLGLIVLALGGWMADRYGPVSPGALSVVGIGCFAVASRWQGDPGWMPFGIFCATAAIGFALHSWARQLPTRLVGPMFAVTAFGIWVTVPETELARLLLGVAVVLAAGTLPPTKGRLTGAGSYALAGVVVWVVAVGGFSREASVVGGWASMAGLVLFPLVSPSLSHLIERRPWLTLAAQCVLVFVTARVIGLWASASPAILAIIVVAIISYAGLTYYASKSAAVHAGNWQDSQ